jgi:hypothetical protein
MLEGTTPIPSSTISGIAPRGNPVPAFRTASDDRSASSTRVGDIMTKQVVACRPQDDVKQAERLMSQHHKSRILCIDDPGKLVGVISLSDMAQNQATDAAETLMIDARSASVAMADASCEVCGNQYDKAFQVVVQGATHTFDSFECAIQALAPSCSHCRCHIIGHGVEHRDGKIFCCAHCANRAGASGLRDRV